MLFSVISRILGLVIFGLGIAMFIPLAVAIYFDYFADPLLYPQPHSTTYFVETILITFAIAFLFYRIGKGQKANIYRKEGLVAVVLIWVLLPMIATLPFLLSKTLENPFIAYFEMVSGLTTTGSTALEAKRYDETTGQEIPIRITVPGVIPKEYVYYGSLKPVIGPDGKVLRTGVEAMSVGLQFWRSFIQWLGGGGVMVLFIALLPAIGGGTRILFTAEVAGPIKDTLTPRVRETAIKLWRIYTGLTVTQIILLLATNDQMPIFDAVTISLTTISTGGFSIHNASIGYYQNAATEWVIILFMFLGAVNFSLYYYISKGKFFKLYDMELIVFVIMILIASGLSAWFLVGTPEILLTGGPEKTFNVSEAIRFALFQIVSIHTSTGFTTADYDRWPFAVQAIMLIVMYFGGMSGSTAGGIKISRVMMLFRVAQFRVESLFQPHRVRTFRIGGKEVDNNVATMALCFFLIIIAISAAGAFLLILDGIDFETAFSLVASTVNNIGVAFRAAGPSVSCSFLSNFSLMLCSILMLLGRLEFFVVLAILVPAFWKKNS